MNSNTTNITDELNEYISVLSDINTSELSDEEKLIVLESVQGVEESLESLSRANEINLELKESFNLKTVAELKENISSEVKLSKQQSLKSENRPTLQKQ
ncbi:TPA: hypothetical protein I7730_20375 [Vibrio vulnificus]|uniref:Uncharacterized protein n=1 Tax=Vibrio vulnificus TaxID=672 RepID=A0A8H9N3J7_VIBVL|nr:hypothetical protein [Vibrio vulnificus]HAS8542148.1 hypothetical protein [Vibrio vulnificus]